jgi:hypothetical protein
MLGFPGRGFLARAQPDDRIADPDRFTRFHRQIARLAVALVEQAERRDALVHRRRALIGIGRITRHVDRLDAA